MLGSCCPKPLEDFVGEETVFLPMCPEQTVTCNSKELLGGNSLPTVRQNQSEDIQEARNSVG